MHADTPVCQPPPAYLPALPASPFAETQLQPQQHVSPPGSPTPAVAQLMRSLTLSGTAQPPSPTSSGSSAAAATAMLGITPACAEALAPVSCSSKLVSVPSSAACPANGLGPAPASDDGLQLCAQHLRAKLAEQAQQAQRGMAATLLQQQALAPRARAMLPQPTAAAAQGDFFNDTFLKGSTLAADSPAGWGQQQGFQQHMQVVSALLLQPQGEQTPSAVYQAGSLAPTARLGASTISTQPHGAGSGAPGACRSSLPLLQGPKGWADFKPSRASLAGAYSVQQAQQAALHTAAQALLMHQLPAHLQVQALLQQQQQLQLQSVAARLWQQGAHNPRHMPHAQHSMKRQVAGPLASQPPKHAEPNDPPESLLGIDGRYQPYCQQVITPRLNQAAACALAAVKLLQAGDAPTPHLAHGKRFFCSLKEVAKVVPAAKCLIVAPDVRISPTAHINPVAALQRILRAAEACNVPIVFALSRRGIGQVFGRDKSMSIVAIMHLEGLEGHFDVMLQEAIKGRQLFKQYCAGTALAASHHSGTLNAALLHHGGAEYAATGTYRGPPGAFPYSEAATALLHQGLPNLQPFLSTLFS